MAGPAGSGSIDPALSADIAAAVADLAGRLHVDAAAIEPVSAQLVTWPDAALGCPAPGRSYIQVPVDGAEIVLAHGAQHFSYHMGGSTGPFLCEPAAPDKSVPTKISTSLVAKPAPRPNG